MLRVIGLPIEITKADLDELFSPYGTILITEKSVFIEIGETTSTVYLELNETKGENRAIHNLNNTLFRGEFTLGVDKPLGDGIIRGMRLDEPVRNPRSQESKKR